MESHRSVSLQPCSWKRQLIFFSFLFFLTLCRSYYRTSNSNDQSFKSWTIALRNNINSFFCWNSPVGTSCFCWPRHPPQASPHTPLCLYYTGHPPLLLEVTTTAHNQGHDKLPQKWPVGSFSLLTVSTLSHPKVSCLWQNSTQFHPEKRVNSFSFSHNQMSHFSCRQHE